MSNTLKMSGSCAVQSLCVITILTGAALLAVAQEPGVTARDAWAPMPAASKVETAVYVVLENHTAARRTVIGGSSDMAKAVEIHEARMEKNMMKMVQVDHIDVPANGKAELKSGSFHIMVFGLKKPLAAGDSLTLTLKLDNGATVPITAMVRKQESMEGMK